MEGLLLKSYFREAATRTTMPPFDGPVIATMPLEKNVPHPSFDDWELDTCPRCGRKCWRMGETAKLAIESFNRLHDNSTKAYMEFYRDNSLGAYLARKAKAV